MFHIQSLFTRISHNKTGFIMLYGDVLFTPLYGGKIAHTT